MYYQKYPRHDYPIFSQVSKVFLTNIFVIFSAGQEGKSTFGHVSPGDWNLKVPLRGTMLSKVVYGRPGVTNPYQHLLPTQHTVCRRNRRTNRWAMCIHKKVKLESSYEIITPKVLEHKIMIWIHSLLSPVMIPAWQKSDQKKTNLRRERDHKRHNVTTIYTPHSLLVNISTQQHCNKRVKATRWKK